MDNMEMDNQKIIRHVVRLVVERELSDAEIAEFFDIVDEAVEVADSQVNEDESYDTPVLMYDDDGAYTYEIQVNEKVEEDQSYEIAQEIADTLDDDFQFEIV